MLFQARTFSGIAPLLACTLAGLLSACSSYLPGYPDTEDSGPGHRVDISQIPDAVPRQVEPSRYGNPESYVVFGRRYHVLDSSEGYVARGRASWYGTKFHGRRTSSGEPYSMYAMTAAHKTLPIPTYARVTNLDNGKSIIVKINDRGPFVKGRLIDLSYVAARKLGIAGQGTGNVEVRTITPSVSVPATTVATKPGPVSSASAERNLYLQVGLFRDRLNAEQLRKKLTLLPLPDIQVSADTSNSHTLYRVSIGPLGADAEADQLIELLARQGHKGFRIRID